MNIRHFPLLIGLMTMALPLASSAQASAPEASASRPPASPQIGPRLLTPAERRDNANAAGSPDVRPDRPVVPQISIPFGKNPPPVRPSSSAPRAATRAPSGGVADAAARCDSEPSDEERAACRKRARAAAPN